MRSGMHTAVGVALALAACGGSGSSCPLGDDLDDEACATLQAMRQPTALPPSPSNAKADDLDAARLGFKIFFDARFSRSHKLRCEGCHAPETHFHDLAPVAIGAATGTRNTPSVLNVARRSRGFFWDGRADVLWAPPVLAMENPGEMAMTRLEIAHIVATFFGAAYTPVWGALPALDDAARFPAIGGPGDPAWVAMAPADQDAINRVAANVGKSLEAYLRKLVTGDAPFDRFLDGDRAALTATQRRGMRVFVEAGCAGCHGGPLFTDDGYHDLGLPAVGDRDPGRAAAIAVERGQLFAPDGPYADVPVANPIADASADDAGALRTPSLRNVALTAPYMHDGRFDTLEAAVDFHLAGGGERAGGRDPLLVATRLGADDRVALLAFLGALNGKYPDPPWNDWVDRP